jgi:hypothetical protein
MIQNIVVQETRQEMRFDVAPKRTLLLPVFICTATAKNPANNSRIVKNAGPERQKVVCILNAHAIGKRWDCVCGALFRDVMIDTSVVVVDLSVRAAVVVVGVKNGHGRCQVVRIICQPLVAATNYIW